jgi:hypothetical protein
MADPKDTTAEPTDARQPYDPPAVSWEQPFPVEASLASACGKIGGSGEPCDSAPAS